MTKQELIQSAKAIRAHFKARAGRMSLKAAGVFALAFGGGFILSTILSPILAPFLSFLNIGLYGNLTVLALVFGTLFTYPLLVIANKSFHTSD